MPENGISKKIHTRQELKRSVCKTLMHGNDFNGFNIFFKFKFKLMLGKWTDFIEWNT